MTMTLHYLAYGSNLHPLRLRQRVPSAHLLGCVTLQGYRLAFHKLGMDGSAKCDMVGCGSHEARVHAAVYTIDAVHKPWLDRYEDRGRGYVDATLAVEFNGVEIDCLVYLAQASHIRPDIAPFDWYRQLVLMGARHLNFPADYIEQITQVDTNPDPDPHRSHTHQALLQQIERD